MQFKNWQVLAIVVGIAILTYTGVKLVETATEKARLDKLIPNVRQAVVRLRNVLAEKGLKTLVGQTLRTSEEQAVNVSTGKSDTQDSWHLLGRAIDLYVYRDGQAWDKGDLTDYRTMHTEAAKLGFTGIAFNSDGSKKLLRSGVWDGGHLQYQDGLTFAQAKAQTLVA